MRFIRDGEERGKGVWRWGRWRLDTCRYAVTTRMSPALKMGINVSLIVRDKVTRQCPQTPTFEEKGEPKQIQTEVLLLTSLTPYH